jgi:hypothetical protein
MTDIQLHFCIPRSKCYLALFHLFRFLLLKKSPHCSKFSNFEREIFCFWYPIHPTVFTIEYTTAYTTTKCIVVVVYAAAKSIAKLALSLPRFAIRIAEQYWSIGGIGRYWFYWVGHRWSVSHTGITRPLANGLPGAKKRTGARKLRNTRRATSLDKVAMAALTGEAEVVECFSIYVYNSLSLYFV